MGIGKGLDGLLAVEKGKGLGAIEVPGQELYGPVCDNHAGRHASRTTLSPRLSPYGYEPIFF